MRRRTFDALLSAVGVVVTLTLIVAGALLMWGAVFTNSEVQSQLSAQKIVFPAKSALEGSAYALARPYAGEQLLTGVQAEAYANGKILPDLNEIAGGKTYSQLSAESLAQPKNTTLSGLVATVFKGTTLRSELLEAYGFSVFGQIALISSIVSFVLAGVMLVLSLLGLAHFRRTPPTVELQM